MKFLGGGGGDVWLVLLCVWVWVCAKSCREKSRAHSEVANQAMIIETEYRFILVKLHSYSDKDTIRSLNVHCLKLSTYVYRVTTESLLTHLCVFEQKIYYAMTVSNCTRIDGINIINELAVILSDKQRMKSCIPARALIFQWQEWMQSRKLCWLPYKKKPAYLKKKKEEEMCFFLFCISCFVCLFVCSLLIVTRKWKKNHYYYFF